ncbi:membrane fusion protein [Roseateles sp. YR242]|nr:membrane fusion protein [Roseateles sp. YR242]
MTVFVLFAMIALLTFMAAASYDQKVALSGVLVPAGGVLSVYSPEAATVAKILVKEGQYVEASTPLIKFQSDRATVSGRLAAMQEDAFEKRKRAIVMEGLAAETQWKQRDESLNRQLRNLLAEVDGFEADLANSRSRIALSKVTVQRYRELAAQGFVPQLSLQQREEELLDLQLRERSIVHQMDNSRRLIDAARADLASNRATYESTTARSNGERAALDQEWKETSARNEWLVEAPEGGQIVNINVLKGQFTTAGVAVITILPATSDGKKLVANLYAASHVVGLVEAGQSAAIQYAAFPYQKFGLHEGRIDVVGTTPINPQDIPPGQAEAIFATLATREPLYRIQVAIPSQYFKKDGQIIHLKPGMTLTAQVKLERRQLWEWMFEPLFSLTKGRQSN